jgi:two-component system OmpR family response regulator
VGIFVVLNSKALMLDQNSKILRILGKEIHLTKTEYLLIELLLLNEQRIVERSDVLTTCKLFNGKGCEQILNLHVSRLRIKIREAGGGDYIFSTPGFGLSLNHPSTFKSC